MDIKILENLFQVTIERGKPVYNRHNQIIHKRIMVDLGLLKSGKVELQSTIDQGNLRKFLGIYCQKLTLIVRNLFSAEMRIPQGTESLIHDRTVKPVVVNNQEQAYSENFVTGSDRSRICEQSQRPSAKQTEKNVERCRVR